MSVMLAKEIKPSHKEMRNVYCETLTELAKDNRDILVMDSDLMNAMGTKPFMAEFPEQTVNCGIMEANMMGVAAGLSMMGKIPFCHTFGCFATRRPHDQVYESGAYSLNNVKIVGSDPGLTAALNGGTHMSIEDMGTMMSIPDMDAMEPTDPVMLAFVLREMSKKFGMQYMRLARKQVPVIYSEGSTFEIGKANLLRDGKDATIITSGLCVYESLKAAATLAEQGINVRVLDMFTWKPIDADAINKAAAETGAIVTAENHNVVNGLGSAVANVLVKNKPVPMEMIGVQDKFGEVGPIEYLIDKFEISEKFIVEAVKKAMARKA